MPETRISTEEIIIDNITGHVYRDFANGVYSYRFRPSDGDREIKINRTSSRGKTTWFSGNSTIPTSVAAKLDLFDNTAGRQELDAYMKEKLNDEKLANHEPIKAHIRISRRRTPKSKEHVTSPNIADFSYRALFSSWYKGSNFGIAFKKRSDAYQHWNEVREEFKQALHALHGPHIREIAHNAIAELENARDMNIPSFSDRLAIRLFAECSGSGFSIILPVTANKRDKGEEVIYDHVTRALDSIGELKIASYDSHPQLTYCNIQRSKLGTAIEKLTICPDDFTEMNIEFRVNVDYRKNDTGVAPKTSPRKGDVRRKMLFYLAENSNASVGNIAEAIYGDDNDINRRKVYVQMSAARKVGLVDGYKITTAGKNYLRQ